MPPIENNKYPAIGVKVDKEIRGQTFYCNKCNYTSENKRSYKNHLKKHTDKKTYFECIYPLCNYGTIAKRTLLAHIQNVHEPSSEMLTCKLCNYQVSKTQRSNYTRHVTNIHLKRRVIKCPECVYSTTNKWDVEKHIKCIHRKIKDYCCPLCEYKTSYKYILVRHEKAVHNGVKDISCPDSNCDYATTLKKYLARHIKTEHESEQKKFFCNLCAYKTIEKSILDRHTSNVHAKQKVYNCNICHHTTNSKYNLEKHLKVVHEKINDFKCSFCSYETSERHALAVHNEEIHDMQLKFKCNECDRRFSKKGLLKCHQNQVHIKKEIIRCSVSGCKYIAKKDEYLTEHKKRCHNIGNIICGVCSVEAVEREEMKIHFKESHADLKLMVCTECTFITYSQREFIKHVKACHDVIIPLSCNKCSYVPISQIDLKIHQKEAHQIAGTCDKCEFEFSHVSVLKKHKIKIHNEINKFPCTHCSLIYERNSDLKTHLRIEHWRLMDRQEIRCTQCDFKSGYDDLMNIHLKKEHKNDMHDNAKVVRREWIEKTLQEFNLVDPVKAENKELKIEYI